MAYIPAPQRPNKDDSLTNRSILRPTNVPNNTRQSSKAVIVDDVTTAYIEELYDLIDGYQQESHTLDSTISRLPTEDGSSITDHIVYNPEKLTLTGKVSLKREGSEKRLSRSQERVRQNEFWSKIRELMENKTVLSVYTTWGVYETMAIKSAQAEPSGMGMKFTLTLSQILRVGISSEITPENSLPPANEMPNETALGKSSTEPIEIPDPTETIDFPLTSIPTTSPGFTGAFP